MQQYPGFLAIILSEWEHLEQLELINKVPALITPPSHTVPCETPLGITHRQYFR